MSIVHPASILFKDANKIIPKEVLGQILVNADGSVGSARIIDGAFQIFRQADTLDLEAVMSVQQGELKEPKVLFFLSKRKPPDDELQPIEILADGEDPILITFFEGDVNQDKIEELVANQLGACGGDLIKAMNMMDGPAFRTKMSEAWKERGTIILMDVTGKILIFRNNSKFEEQDWGWTSNAFKPDPKPVASVPPTGTKMTPAQRVALMSGTAAAPDLTKPRPAEGASELKPDVVPGTGEQPDVKEEMFIMGPPPASLTNKQKRAWWMTHLGYDPPNYKSSVVSVAKSKILKMPATGISSATVPKDAHRPALVPQKGLAALEQVASEVHTVLEPKLIEAIKDEFAKAKIKVMTAVEREDFAKKYPMWSTQFGVTIPVEQTFGWDFEVMRQLCVKYPFAAAVLMYEALALYQEAITDLDKLTGTTQKPEETNVKMTPAQRVAAMAGK